MAERIPFFVTGLPQLPTNVDPKIEPDLRDVYNALRNLTYQLGQYGGFETMEDSLKNVASLISTAGPYKRRVYCEALEAIAYGAIVHLADSGGTLKARHANATDATRPGYGICNTPGVCAIGATIEIALPGCYVTSIGGLTRGERYFLSTVNGVLTNVAPAAVGNIVEVVGFALEADIFYFWPSTQWWVV